MSTNSSATGLEQPFGESTDSENATGTELASPTPDALSIIMRLEEPYRTQVLAFYNETVSFERTIGVIIPSIFAVVILLGVIGNALVVVVALNKLMRNSTNTLIIGLAVSDLMFLLLCVPFTAVDYVLPVWVFPTFLCNAINYFQHTSAYFSVWTLCIMSVDRFLAVVYPVDSLTWRTAPNTVLVLALVYTLIALSQLPVGAMHGVYYYDFIIERRSTCAIVGIAKNEATVTQARLYFLTFNFFGYALPLGITCVLYYIMLKRLWHTPRPGHHNAVSAIGSVRSRPETIKAKRKVTRLVLCVVVIWALCWLPLNVCFFFSGMAYPDTLVLKYGKIMVLVQISSQVLAYTNSCLNPILYALMSDNFRKGFIRVICNIGRSLTCGLLCADKPQRHIRMETTNVHCPLMPNQSAPSLLRVSLGAGGAAVTAASESISVNGTNNNNNNYTSDHSMLLLKDGQRHVLVTSAEISL